MSSWSDSLIIGVKLIDDQHYELVSRMDHLVDACHRGCGHDEVGDTLKFVVSYIQHHFKDEEELQALYAYPDMAAHKALHAGFVQRTIALMQELKTGELPDFTDKVKSMIVGWFLMHIKTEDRKLGEHINQAEAVE